MVTEIYDWEDLHNMRDNLSETYELMNDLTEDTPGYDTYASSNANGGEGWQTITSWAGAFHGNNHTIKTLYINSDTNRGLFSDEWGYRDDYIKDFKLEVDITHTDNWGVAAISDTCFAYVDNVHVTGNITGGSTTAGIVGQLNSRTVSNCSFEGTINGNGRVGGIIGFGDYATVSNCYVKATIEGEDEVGGVIGNLVRSGFSNCYFEGDVTGNDIVGGFAGSIRVLDNNSGFSYSAATVTGNSNVGGFNGALDSNSYPIYNCFWDTDIGPSTSASGTGKTTDELKTISTFNDTSTSGLDEEWNIISVQDYTDETWFINNDYPRLNIEYDPADYEFSTISNLLDVNGSLIRPAFQLRLK